MFNLDEYRKKRQKRIEAALDTVLPPEDVEPAELHRAMRYAVFTGGKRLRPLLAVAAAEAVGGSIDQAMPAAVALELFHAYTLVHDDLPAMDDDEVRRGQPTVHIKFGEANAILVGDALQALAFEVLADSEHANTLLRELAQAGGSRGVAGGQWADLAYSNQLIGEREILYIHEHKTAALLRAAVRMGAISSHAKKQYVESLTAYGSAIGHAFQLTDDLLDADEEERPTAIAVLGADKAQQEAQQYIEQAHASLKGIPHTEALSSIADFIIKRTH